MTSSALKPIAVDPIGCDCNDCTSSPGEYISLQNATKEDILALARGELGDNTSKITHVEYEISGVTISIGSIRYVYDDLDINSLPPKNLRFERLRITFDEENFNRIRDWL